MCEFKSSKMSTDAQGSTPNYRDSVRDMMRELKATKGSGKAPTVAAAVAVAKVVEDKSSDNLHVVSLTISNFLTLYVILKVSGL